MEWPGIRMLVHVYRLKRYRNTNSTMCTLLPAIVILLGSKSPYFLSSRCAVRIGHASLPTCRMCMISRKAPHVDYYLYQGSSQRGVGGRSAPPPPPTPFDRPPVKKCRPYSFSDFCVFSRHSTKIQSIVTTRGFIKAHLWGVKPEFTLYVTFCMARQFWTMEKMGHGVTFSPARPSTILTWLEPCYTLQQHCVLTCIYGLVDAIESMWMQLNWCNWEYCGQLNSQCSFCRVARVMNGQCTMVSLESRSEIWVLWHSNHTSPHPQRLRPWICLELS